MTVPKLPLSFPLDQAVDTIRLSDKGSYYILELNAPPDNRLTPSFITAFIEALDTLKFYYDPKPLVTTSTSPKFYSNGLDYELAQKTPNFMSLYFYPLLKAFVDFPWPTIANINGHCFAGAFCLAAFHDYRVMNPAKGWLCMNELEFDAPLMGPLMSIYVTKFGAAIAQRISLNAERFTAKTALEAGLIHAHGSWPEVEEIVKRIGEYSNRTFYSQMRAGILRNVLTTMDYDNETRILHERRDRLWKYEDENKPRIGALLSKL
ncbi:YALI0D00671p [Yarrowia lipolytica CLIB122]|uniref:YALI0D00671p n=2 Tax=Yarrowia lipolytica TaxID=4952 RepID=Q6CAR1_YARLI|nr:YALI0D00671p [Yarrowia lipolytica CLIB122]AOW03389.1 hypothetical protein YALI1_D00724g [Yarrowia lipolytica]KAB8282579.1 ClpP/crotonase-like domain-containing protein [Yarrowia lipolytica]KAE8173229.1 ClpP/crotonase-like domain-containing protein [Yarrowia lipolytica]KAJ8054951.1 ClpP/crotonase-like domain-containing protein [Yarrowia lipolytica]RMI96825.1 ClpP/crotonase-like domain-containing protein [Yarrowia lipolytica]|eukprot:XP_502251.1 YALI0D00671p [Yarrowia lipolytica CLIB122]